MAGLTKKELKDLIKEAVKETITDSGILKDLLSECIKTSVVMIIKEINIPDKEITESRGRSIPKASTSLFEEKPLVTAASKTKLSKKEPVTNGDALREMFANEFGISPPTPGAGFNQPPLQDMVDTEEDDPRVLKALGLM